MENRERSGILLALCGFALLSCGDAVIKTMAGAWSPIAVAALRFCIGAVVLSALLFWREGARAFVPANFWLQVGRGICLTGATICFFSAIFVMPLAEAMALSFVSPIFVAILSWPLLGEKAPRATWIVSLIALVGVGLILRPNFAELGWMAVLPISSALFFALMLIANRASAGQGSTLSMQAFLAISAAPFLTVAAFIGHQTGSDFLAVTVPDWSVVAKCALVAVSASIAHGLAFLGTMRAGASTIAPTTYVQLIIAGVLGWAFFDDMPDATSMLGAAIIIAGGIVLWRSAKPVQPAA
ncbi:DMT family transporter [Qipengyuania sp. DGS5-3]|uniref:DMT family transporter n=1 Tax=Qipengyuania sp. DGS5-3 TaxID=3349632 RepID=UPI0036D2AE19